MHVEPPEIALSIRQPWATLVVLGLKSLEIRRWSTPIRGPVYIHAGKIADERREGWPHVPEDHFELTRRRGGLIGTADLVDCIAYTSVPAFARDRQLHLNRPSWFVPPRLFGFRFEGPKIVPFRAISGQVKFFPVPMMPTPPTPEVPLRTTGPKKLVTFELQ